MGNSVIVYGKEKCPYTKAALNAFVEEGKQVEYIDVVDFPDRLPEMLKHSDGIRKVPVILENGSVSVGYKGKG